MFVLSISTNMFATLFNTYCARNSSIHIWSFVLTLMRNRNLVVYAEYNLLRELERQVDAGKPVTHHLGDIKQNSTQKLY